MRKQFLLVIESEKEIEAGKLVKILDANFEGLAKEFECQVSVEEIEEMTDLSPLDEIGSLNPMEAQLVNERIQFRTTFSHLFE